MEETVKKKRRKKYKIETYQDIYATTEKLLNDCLNSEEMSQEKRIRLANELLRTRLASLKQHELQIEVDKMNAMLEEWKDAQRGDLY